MSPGSIPPPLPSGLWSLWAGQASQVAVSCPGWQWWGMLCCQGSFSTTLNLRAAEMLRVAGWKCWWVCAWPGGECKAVARSASSREQQDQSSVCRALLQEAIRGVLSKGLLSYCLPSGKRSSQAERCPVGPAWLLVPGVDCGSHQDFVTEICPRTQCCLLPAQLGVTDLQGA